MNYLPLSLLPPSWKMIFHAWWAPANDIMFVYHLFLACAQIIMTDSSLGMWRHFLLAYSLGWRIFLTDSSAGVSLLALIGPNGLYLKIEVCLVKLQMQPLSLCLLLAEEDCEVVSLGKWKQVEITEGIIFSASFTSFWVHKTFMRLQNSALKWYSTSFRKIVVMHLAMHIPLLNLMRWNCFFLQNYQSISSHLT